MDEERPFQEIRLSLEPDGRSIKVAANFRVEDSGELSRRPSIFYSRIMAPGLLAQASRLAVASLSGMVTNPENTDEALLVQFLRSEKLQVLNNEFFSGRITDKDPMTLGALMADLLAKGGEACRLRVCRNLSYLPLELLDPLWRQRDPAVGDIEDRIAGLLGMRCVIYSEFRRFSPTDEEASEGQGECYVDSGKLDADPIEGVVPLGVRALGWGGVVTNNAAQRDAAQAANAMERDLIETRLNKVSDGAIKNGVVAPSIEVGSAMVTALDPLFAAIDTARKGEYSILHYYCHHDADTDGFRLCVDDGVYVTRGDWTWADPQIRRRALHFFNICSVLPSNDDGDGGLLCHVEGQYSPAAAICSLMPLRNLPAAKFANEFYKQSFKPGSKIRSEPLGMVVHRARKALLEQGDPVGLLYRYFGSPGIHFSKFGVGPQS